ncbi:MAG: Panacea domain-containing protein [Tagaea sp.]|nr:Panacea domain-containing protein [Tagaea sp.]
MDELVLYTCERVERPADLGAVKLQKVFWFSDTALYAKRRRALTDARYVKGPHGPMSPDVEKSIKRLKEAGRLVERAGTGRSEARRQFFAVTPADVSKFSGDEISVLDAHIDAITRDFTAAEISDATHDRVWKAAKPGERLPLWTIYAAEPIPPSASDIEWAEAVVTQDDLDWSEAEFARKK